MYRLFISAIEKFVSPNFGLQTCQNIKNRNSIGIYIFLSTDSLGDNLSFRITQALSKITELLVKRVLTVVRICLSLYTRHKMYRNLIKAGGKALKELLITLLNFHNRILLYFLKRIQAEFKICHILANNRLAYYYSKRPALKNFVLGLLQGLSKLYNTFSPRALLECRGNGFYHEIIKIS